MEIHTRKTLTDDCEVVKVDELKVVMRALRCEWEQDKTLSVGDSISGLSYVLYSAKKAKTDSEGVTHRIKMKNEVVFDSEKKHQYIPPQHQIDSLVKSIEEELLNDI